MAMSLARRRSARFCANSPKATFSQTGRLSKRAEPWNSMPNLRLISSRRPPPTPPPPPDSGEGPPPRGPKAENALQQPRLAAAGAADDYHRFAVADIEIQVAQHDLAAERLAEAADADLGWGLLLNHRAKNSSVRM